MGMDRSYHRHRARSEILAAMEAGDKTAADAHAGLAELHLRDCFRHHPGRTWECVDCVMTNICASFPVAPATVRNGDPQQAAVP